MLDKPIFPTALIPTAVASSLPDGYKLRPLEKSDYSRGILDVLRDLTEVGDISQSEFEEHYDTMSRNKDTYYTIVIENAEGKIVGTGQLIVELKFIHHCGKVGHVEDIAVAKSEQGKGFGKKIIATMDQMAQELGCYKTLLDCSEKNRGFYEKCGYKWKEHHMSRYYLETSSDQE